MEGRRKVFNELMDSPGYLIPSCTIGQPDVGVDLRKIGETLRLEHVDSEVIGDEILQAQHTLCSGAHELLRSLKNSRRSLYDHFDKVLIEATANELGIDLTAIDRIDLPRVFPLRKWQQDFYSYYDIDGSFSPHDFSESERFDYFSAVEIFQAFEQKFADLHKLLEKGYQPESVVVCDGKTCAKNLIQLEAAKADQQQFITKASDMPLPISGNATRHVGRALASWALLSASMNTAQSPSQSAPMSPSQPIVINPQLLIALTLFAGLTVMALVAFALQWQQSASERHRLPTSNKDRTWREKNNKEASAARQGFYAAPGGEALPRGQEADKETHRWANRRSGGK